MSNPATFSRQIASLIQRSTALPHLLQLHTLLLKTALDHHHGFVSRLISSLCPHFVEHARSIFVLLSFSPSTHAWNSLIRAHARRSHGSESVCLFSDMRRAGVAPDCYTYPFVLKACGSFSMEEEGKTVHGLVVKAGFLEDSYVGNNLLHMYACNGMFGWAHKVFDEMVVRDVVAWSSMIEAYVARSLPSEALMLFRQMRAADVNPNSVTLVSLLSASSSLANLRLGQAIHSYIVINKLKMDVALGTAVMDMYAKCGHVDEAFRIFDLMDEKNIQSWTIMISGFADHGRGEDAIALFTQLEDNGMRPDSIAFSSILSACSHLGLVDEGRHYFDRMVNLYKIQPRMEHCGCMVDLFGRAGMVEEAYEFIQSMPVKPNSVVLRSFLGACRKHGAVCNVDGKLTKLLIKEEPNIGANYVITANVSALSGNWREAAQLRCTMLRKRLKKVPGCSWMELNCSVVSSSHEKEQLVGCG